jgi:hypothetical protein
MKTTIFGIALTVVFADIFTISDVQPSKAQGPSTFVIAATSGYGLEDCLGEGGECGRVVADAWRKAHGQGAALKFGQENQSGVLMANLRRPSFITCEEYTPNPARKQRIDLETRPSTNKIGAFLNLALPCAPGGNRYA